MPDADEFRALARSSPWLWRSVHLRYRGGLGAVEAWVERPGRLRVRFPSGAERVEEQEAPAAYTALGGTGGPPPPRLPHEVEPARRPDGLVTHRPDDLGVVYGDPIWSDYSWVALLDPVELSAGVFVGSVTVADREGRETWTAQVSPVADYNPTCPCCALLWSRVAAEGSGLPVADTDTFPEAYDVALDRATGIVTSLRPSDRQFADRASLSFEVNVLGHEPWPPV